jgi:fatty acid-binding protein DegV
MELTKEKVAGRKIEKLSILHVKAPEAGKQFEQLVRSSVPCPEGGINTQISPGLSIHTGAGMVAMVFVVGK